MVERPPPTDRRKRSVRDGTATPAWVKVFGLIAIVVVIVLAIGVLTGGHGPARHAAPANGAVLIVAERLTLHGREEAD